MTIKVAIAGIGNCCSSLVQGISYYGSGTKTDNGLVRSSIGGYDVGDIEIVCCFDIDKRKVGKTLKEAIIAPPNCTPMYCDYDLIPDGPIVSMGPVLDGVAPHMLEVSDSEGFRVSTDTESVDVVKELVSSGADILINYLPVGSQKATEFYAQCCLDAKIGFMNCIPVFIASDPVWEQKFIDAGLPIVGDDMKSQFGASILSQMIQELAFSRGHKVKCHIQRNVGGNTDFLNMVDQTRLKSKKISKENVIKSQNRIRKVSCEESFLHAGPSEYIRYYGDNKVANFRVEMEGFMGAPVILDAQLSVMDSPNSAGVVIDAIRYLVVAKEMGICGALRGPSAFTQKSPPLQMTFVDSLSECDALSSRTYTPTTKIQTSHYNAVELLSTTPSHNTKL